ncbi:MAG: hypothetical protein IJP70_07995 [Bacteroidales bacterium]|nr:hypothetical protein [Bacteroidales bacterium]
MKTYKLIIDTAALTKQKMEAACKFLDEIDNTEGVEMNPDSLTINFDEDKDDVILSIAAKYGIVDLTDM